MKRFSGIVLLLASLTLVTPVHAQAPCDTNRAIGGDGGNADFAAAVRRSLNIAAIGPANCNSFLAVLRQLVNSKPRAGSQLKTAGGPDPAVAAREMAEMRKDAAQAAALDAIQKEPDAFTRVLLEASHFHQNGMYTARDLRLEEARKLVEGK